MKTKGYELKATEILEQNPVFSKTKKTFGKEKKRIGGGKVSKTVVSDIERDLYDDGSMRPSKVKVTKIKEVKNKNGDVIKTKTKNKNDYFSFM